MIKKSLAAGVFIMSAAAIITSSAASAAITEKTPGAVKGVKLLEAWVKSGAPNGAFTYKDMSGNETKATFDTDIMPLFNTDNIWGEDTSACTACHTAKPDEAAHELDLTSYKGMMKGADTISKPPGVGIFGESKIGATDYNWGHSKLKGRLRNNRMPPGAEFDMTEENRDGPTGKEVGIIAKWVKKGAPNDADFKKNILPMFTTDGVWGEDTSACTACHTAKPDEAAHEMNLTSYKGLMSGADTISAPPGVGIFGESKIGATDYNWGHSKLKGRLRNNRMPPGVEFDMTEENRDGPIVLHGKR